MLSQAPQLCHKLHFCIANGLDNQPFLDDCFYDSEFQAYFLGFFLKSKLSYSFLNVSAIIETEILQSSSVNSKIYEGFKVEFMV